MIPPDDNQGTWGGVGWGGVGWGGGSEQLWGVGGGP